MRTGNFKSLNRALKRGHAQVQINKVTGFYEIYRKTATSNKYTVFVTQFNFGL